MNGFKLGGSGVGTPHVVLNCLSFNNGATGFTDNNNPSAEDGGVNVYYVEVSNGVAY